MKTVIAVFFSATLIGCSSPKCATNDEVMDAGKIVGIYAYQQAVIRTGKISTDTYVLAKAIADSITLDHYNKARKQ